MMVWCVGTRKTVSETGHFEDGLDWMVRRCVGGTPRVGAMSNDAGRWEHGSMGAAVVPWQR